MPENNPLENFKKLVESAKNERDLDACYRTAMVMHRENVDKINAKGRQLNEQEKNLAEQLEREKRFLNYLRTGK